MTIDTNAVGRRNAGVEPSNRIIEPRVFTNIGQAKSAPRIVVVGAGLMGRWHLFSARSVGARVIAVVDPDLRAAKALAARAPGARAVADVSDLLSGDLPFAAHVCTPSERHFEVAHVLVAAGVHVLVEKPLCHSLEEARALTAQAYEQRAIVCPVHQYAFQRGVERAMRLLATLGAVRRINFDICSAGAERLPPARRMMVIDEILPHPLSILQRLAPTMRLRDVAWSVTTRPDGEYFAQGCANGTIMSISISLNARPTCFLTRIEADRGAIEIDGFHGFATLSRGSATRLTKIAGPFVRSSSTLGNAALNLAQRVIQQEPAYPGLANLIRRFYSSAAKVNMPPISPDQIVENTEVWSRLRVDAPLPGVVPA